MFAHPYAAGRKIFRNIVQVTPRRVKVIADVAYTSPPVGSEFSPPDTTPPNRLISTICAAGIELRLGARFGWRPLRVPLPLRGDGWLDVVFLSDEMRVTRGNRGGLFVHLRPGLLTPEAAEASQGR